MSTRAVVRVRWAYWLPALAVMAVIFVLSSQSGLRVSEDVAVERPIRFTGHLLAFGLLGGLMLFALCRGQRPRLRDAVLAWGITVVYALTDELHQSLVPTRNGRLDDVLTDALGAIVGIAVAWMLLAAADRVREVLAPGQRDGGTAGDP